MIRSKSVKSYRDVPGWFEVEDCTMFRALLQAQTGSTGDLVELGAYLGRSAVIIGDHLAAGERFVVIDLFGAEAPLREGPENEANQEENRQSYEGLTRYEFEANHLAL